MHNRNPTLSCGLRMRLVLLLALVGSQAACSDPLALDADHLTLQVLASIPKLPDDPLTISGARVTGTTLELDLRYAGGCREHRFAIVAGRGLGKSLPPHTVLRMAHDRDHDQCEAAVSQTIRVDLTPIEGLVRAAGATSLRFELVEPGERLSKVGELRVDF